MSLFRAAFYTAWLPSAAHSSLCSNLRMKSLPFLTRKLFSHRPDSPPNLKASISDTTETTDSFTEIPSITSRAPSPAPTNPKSLTPDHDEFSYTIAGSFWAKRRSSKINDDTERPNSGEDSFFTAVIPNKDGSVEGVALGVADGVGGWADLGYTSMDFSYALCEKMRKFALESQMRDHDNHSSKPNPSHNSLDDQPRRLSTSSTSSLSSDSSLSLKEHDSHSRSTSFSSIGSEHEVDSVYPKNNPPTQTNILEAKSLIIKAYKEIKHEKIIQAGGTTACVGTASKDGLLSIANLGDSFFSVIRNNGYFIQSEQQVHCFNTPYQLAIIPPEVFEEGITQASEDKQLESETRSSTVPTPDATYIDDKPSDAQEYHVQLKRGDIVIFGTDGISDNLSSYDILKSVRQVLKTSERNFKRYHKEHQKSDPKIVGPPQYETLNQFIASNIADTIVREAHNVSVDPYAFSPFSKELQARTLQRFCGGKPDDATALVMIID